MGIAGQRNRSTNRAADARRHATIAVCAPEESIRARIVTALALAGYELSLACSEFEELTAAATDAELSLVVLAHDFEPRQPSAVTHAGKDAIRLPRQHQSKSYSRRPPSWPCSC